MLQYEGRVTNTAGIYIRVERVSPIRTEDEEDIYLLDEMSEDGLYNVEYIVPAKSHNAQVGDHVSVQIGYSGSPEVVTVY